jgi:hypothetical protein
MSWVDLSAIKEVGAGTRLCAKLVPPGTDVAANKRTQAATQWLHIVQEHRAQLVRSADSKPI